MGKLIEMEAEKKIIREVYDILRERGMLPELMERTGLSRNTVISTFTGKFEDLKGKRLLLFKEAVRLVEELNELKARAEEALGK